MIKISINALKKIEALFDEIGYSIRYEKGNFQSGYCILQDKRIVVINKFLPLEGRINSLIDILPIIQFDKNSLHQENKKLFEQLLLNPISK